MIFSFRTLFSCFLRQFTQFLNFFFKNFTTYFLQKMIQLFLKQSACCLVSILQWLAQPFYWAALRAKPNQKMEVASSVQEKDKMADGSVFPSPLPCVVANQGCALRKTEGSPVLRNCKTQGAQHMICMKNLSFSSRPRAKVRCQGPPGSARAQPC